MGYKILAYGLTEAQQSILDAALPEAYSLEIAECATDLIVGTPVCTVIDGTTVRKDTLRSLLAYYMDVGEQLDETVVWLGSTDLPALPSFVRCDDFLQLLIDCKTIICKAQAHYDIMAQYTDIYRYLPKHAIAECLEAEIFSSLGDKPSIQSRRAWSKLSETESGPELLAAVYELTRWMKRENIDYTLKFHAPWDILLVFLDVGQIEFTSKYNENYVICVRKSDLNKIEQWLANHWYFHKPDTRFAVHTLEGLEAGIGKIDLAIMGMQPGEVILVGGRPAMGKTSFAKGIAEHVAKTNKVVFFDLEEGGYVGNTNIRTVTGHFDMDQIYTITEKEKPDLLIIDRLQRIPEIMEHGCYKTIMRAIKRMAQRFQIPVLVTTDLSRDIEERPCPAPCKEDIPAHTVILPFVDTTLLLFRPAYYDLYADRSMARCIIEQAHRTVPTFRLLRWDEENHRFTD